ncbi:PGRP and LysM peptidoglycan-binding domain-containing protein [Dyella silvatica]|uniref:PGRP and LysM peptidoglycan-binding domain-containing protein n=1 Tax=Dyella silvatica TaxID=2992128 RepID=UPI002253CF02|nr:peptidoglycan-binding protein [Dyella silvatica]
MEYIIRQGDYLSKVARQFGYADWKILWNHPSNAKLKSQRKNPNVLYPGDVLFIPEKGDKDLTRPTDNTHRFTVKGTPLKLIVVLDHPYAKPLAHTRCDLSLEGGSSTVTTDGHGKFAQDIAPTTEEVRIIVRKSGSPIDGLLIPLRVGYLDPVDELSGQRERLNNLGYAAGAPAEADATARDKLFRSAVEEFQCDLQLQVDGICGPLTQAKLKSTHGC